jgi:hypothetical protein
MLMLYAYCVGTVSSRRFKRACYENQAFRVLTDNQQKEAAAGDGGRMKGPGPGGGSQGRLSHQRSGCRTQG